MSRRLLFDGLPDQLFHVLGTSGPEGVFYGNTVAVAETGLEIAGGCQADAVTILTEFSMNGADKADAALKAVDVVIAGRAVAMGEEIRRYANLLRNGF